MYSRYPFRTLQIRNSPTPAGILKHKKLFLIEFTARISATSYLSMSNPREVAKKLFLAATESRVRFPKIWDESKIVQSCGTTLVYELFLGTPAFIPNNRLGIPVFIDVVQKWSGIR